MAKCRICGKKGMFLKVDSLGICQDCREKQAIDSAQQAKRRKVLEQISEPVQPATTKHADQQYSEALFLSILNDHYLISYKYDKVKICFPNLDRIRLGDILDFTLEPDNDYDKDAVVIEHVTEKLGYVPRGTIQSMIHDYIKKGWPIEGQIDSIADDSATFAIAFYKDIDAFKSITTTLVKTSKKDFFDTPREENLFSVNEGDPLGVMYDDLNETYVVTDEFGSELGELPKKVSDELRANDYECNAICLENNCDDNGKAKCKVKVLIL